jgi:hypothetical protein
MAELRRIFKPDETVSLQAPVVEQPTTAPDPDWLLGHYDFARARALLEKVALANKPGIYIVSSLKPLPASSPPYLVQNLSQATPEVAASWVEAFINEAAQEHSWNPRSQAALVDELRMTLLAISKGNSIVMKWISLL